MKEIKPAILLFIFFTLICGGVYPALVTGIAHVIFPKQAAGSLVSDKAGKIVGSRLIGQPFSDPGHFWPRPSATGEFAYNPMASGGSNLGPTNRAYLEGVAARVKALRDTGISGKIPSELVQASASGLDPDISPEAALLQVPRIARARGLSKAYLRNLVAARTEGRQFGFLGEPRVNVLLLNMALDRENP